MEMVTVSFAEKCGTALLRSLCGVLTGRLSAMLSVGAFDMLSVKPVAMLSVGPLNILSVGLVGTSGSLGAVALSGADSPRVSTKTPALGNLLDTLSMAKGGVLASNCLESAM